MRCPNCGSQEAGNAKFCGACGAPMGAGVGTGAAGAGGTGVAGGSRKKGPPVVLFMILGILAVAAGVVGYVVRARSQDNEPLRGARLKRQTVWENNGNAYVVTGLEFDGSYEGEAKDFPYVIGLEAGNGSLDGLECIAAVDGVRVEAKVGEGGIRLARQHGSWNGGLGVIGRIELVLRDRNTGRRSEVIRLATGKKKEEMPPSERGRPLHDGDGIVAKYRGVYPMYRPSGPGLEFYLENRTGQTVAVGARDVAVRGVGVSGQMDGAFLPGAVGCVILVLDTAEMEGKDLLPMKDVTLSLDVSDAVTGRTLLTVPVSLPSVQQFN